VPARSSLSKTLNRDQKKPKSNRRGWKAGLTDEEWSELCQTLRDFYDGNLPGYKYISQLYVKLWEKKALGTNPPSQKVFQQFTTDFKIQIKDGSLG
jgi:hypothetical protein